MTREDRPAGASPSRSAAGGAHARPRAGDGAVVDEVRALLVRAREVLADRPAALAVVDHQLERLDAPLQVALAGKIKAGKSTLLNALIGAELARSDHAECTRVVTWYRYADVPSVTVHPVDGAPWTGAPRRGPHGLEVDLRGLPAERVERIEVGWPAPGLRRTTLVDTPGLDSVSRDVSRRTGAFLTADGTDSPVDAVVYLMRHLHATDVRFLESFHDARAGSPSGSTTVAVLSRADEVGVGRIDAMIAAGRVAERYRGDPALAPLCQTVVPVAGLLGLTAQTLREDELADLRRLAALDRSVTEDLLLSVDRFRRPSLELPVPAPARDGLLARLGLFGVRLALVLLRSKDLRASGLSDELVRRSGLAELRRVLDAQLTARTGTLRAQAALHALGRALVEHPVRGAQDLRAECERLELAAHGLRELALLSVLRSPGVDLPPAARASAERLLGAHGPRPADRLGLADDAGPAEVARAAGQARAQWSARAEDPLLDRDTRRACRVLVRTCDELGAEVSARAPARA